MAKKSQAARRIRGVDFDKMTRQCRTVLAREIERLMDMSFEAKLSKPDTEALGSYFRLIKDLKKQEVEEMEGMTPEALEEYLKESK